MSDQDHVEGVQTGGEVVVPKVVLPPVRHARDMQLIIPDEGESKLFELFLDNANEPHVKIFQLNGRKVWPLDHPLMRSYVTHHLFGVSGGVLPTDKEVDGFLNVLKAQAFIRGQRNGGAGWEDGVLEQDTLTNCIFVLVSRKAPRCWDATAAQILEAVNVLAAKENLDKGHEWPKAPNRMSIELEKRLEVLKELGVSVIKLARVGTARKWRLAMSNSGGSGGSDAPPIGSSLSASLESSQPKLFDDKELERRPMQDDEFCSSLEQILGEDGSESRLSHDEIVGWCPSRFDQCPGNELAIDEMELVVSDLLAGSPTSNLLVTGADDTGRGWVVELGVRALLCENPGTNGRDRCGECANCLWSVGQETSFGNARKGDQFQFMRVNCATLSPDVLALEASKVVAFQGRLIVFLSGLDLLKKDRVPGLLAVMEDPRFVWFATASAAGAVIPEILKHFKAEMTSNPTAEALATFLAKRCRDWGIGVDSGHTLVRLAHVCGCVLGDAMEVLALAANIEDRKLTRRLVEDSFGS